MSKRCLLLLLVSCFSIHGTNAQKFSRYDYQHGKLTPLRSCYDVQRYTIMVKLNPVKQCIIGMNSITFRAVKDFNTLQIDFARSMAIDSIYFENKKLSYTRDSNATYVRFPNKIKKQYSGILSVYFSGSPRVAKNAPWDGGFVWSKDSLGRDWIGLACEGIGPSVWLPCKDHWSDEAEGLDMHLTVPSGLTGVSNGRLIQTYAPEDSVFDADNDAYKTFHWQVREPINTYSISINAGHYAHISDNYGIVSSVDLNKIIPKLSLDYYVLDYNKAKAEKHFQQVKPMMACFEKHFGPYPFAVDGYKLVETPYWGMEHQSCVAYGNNYKNNKFGFDFIIIHESGHEWFANSITASDPGDMWIHESFTTYAESVYVECTMGIDSAVSYLLSQKHNIVNKEPVVGPRDVYFHGRKDNDIYYKGSWMLHTMRNVLNNDSLWFAALKGFSTHFAKKIITSEDVIRYFNKATGYNWNSFFIQYLYRSNLPKLECYAVTSNNKPVLRYRWVNVVKGFAMPVEVEINNGTVLRLNATTALQNMPLESAPFNIQVRRDRFLTE